MATNPPKKPHRIGVVKERSQVQNPATGGVRKEKAPRK